MLYIVNILFIIALNTNTVYLAIDISQYHLFIAIKYPFLVPEIGPTGRGRDKAFWGFWLNFGVSLGIHFAPQAGIISVLFLFLKTFWFWNFSHFFASFFFLFPSFDACGCASGAGMDLGSVVLPCGVGCHSFFFNIKQKSVPPRPLFLIFLRDFFILKSKIKPLAIGWCSGPKWGFLAKENSAGNSGKTLQKRRIHSGVKCSEPAPQSAGACVDVRKFRKAG